MPPGTLSPHRTAAASACQLNPQAKCEGQMRTFTWRHDVQDFTRPLSLAIPSDMSAIIVVTQLLRTAVDGDAAVTQTSSLAWHHLQTTDELFNLARQAASFRAASNRPNSSSDGEVDALHQASRFCF